MKAYQIRVSHSDNDESENMQYMRATLKLAERPCIRYHDCLYWLSSLAMVHRQHLLANSSGDIEDTCSKVCQVELRWHSLGCHPLATALNTRPVVCQGRRVDSVVPFAVLHVGWHLAVRVTSVELQNGVDPASSC